MCGRFAFYQRPAELRQRLDEALMPSDYVPDDDAVRQTYNFAPGNIGLVYRADVPDTGAGPAPDTDADANDKISGSQCSRSPKAGNEVHYKLQAMKWGLIPFWTKRNPDYGSMIKTINCRDDSLIENRGMWTTMKKRKRCIVICQGFYEWLKKNNGKEKIPHYIKRKDGQLMCLAGLWDCAQYEGAEDKTYTFTIITTEANKQMTFLHDRMPVVLEPGSEELRTWLDPERYEWTSELQSLLHPWDGELEIFPVNKDVGKVGNNSPSFIIPVDSTENKRNIANFFNNQKKADASPTKAAKIEAKVETKEEEKDHESKVKIEQDPDETRATIEHESTEDNAPIPVETRGLKREHSNGPAEPSSTSRKEARLSPVKQSVDKASPSKPARQMRSATNNGTAQKKGSGKTTEGNQRITSFFAK